MIILKKNNHIDETKLDRYESIRFIVMLKTEMVRHELERHKCVERKFYDIGYINSVFWKCQEENHTVDIEMIQKCIDHLIVKWGLN